MKKRRLWILICVCAVALVPVIAVALNLPKPLQASDSAYNLQSLADGSYESECDNGLVYVKVAVDVENHSITGVHLLEHRNGLGKPAEAVTEEVVNRQSVEVDAVAGATMSSQTILKAIENALMQ